MLQEIKILELVGENKKGSQYDSYERLDKFDRKSTELFKLCKKNKIEFMSTPFDRGCRYVI